MDNIKIIRILNEIQEICGNHYLEVSELPKPYKGIEQIKVIILGCDPGNINGARFEYVFGIEGNDKRYFNQIALNLKTIQIGIENIYVQNVCRNYFSIDTSSHKLVWKQCAEKWLVELISELDELDPTSEIPVLITSEIILEVLLFAKHSKAKTYYSEGAFINKDSNKLGRLLIPFYRHTDYSLKKWPIYKDKIISSLFV